jgi:CBS-domain-containing membrane protein
LALTGAEEIIVWRCTAGDIMTPDVTAVTEDALFMTVARILTEHHVNAVAVLDTECRVVGVVSEGDLLSKAEVKEPAEDVSPFLETRRRRASRAKAAGVVARELMSAPAVTATAAAPVAAAAQELSQGRYRQLPVVDNAGRLVGMITRADLIQAFVMPDDVVCAD